MQRQLIGGVVTVGGGGGDGVNNAGTNVAGIGNGSTGGRGGGGGGINGNAAGGSGVSSTYYQNANTVQAAPAWTFQLLPSLYNHYQKVLETPKSTESSVRNSSNIPLTFFSSTRLALHHQNPFASPVILFST